MEEGIESRKKRGKFNQSSSVLVKIVQVGRRNLDRVEYGDGEVMLNGISSSLLNNVSCYTSLRGHMRLSLPFANPEEDIYKALMRSDGIVAIVPIV